MVVVGSCGRERGIRRVLSQSAFPVVEFLPVVVSVALPMVVMRHRVLGHVSKRAGDLEHQRRKNLVWQIFSERKSATRVDQTVWAERQTLHSRAHGTFATPCPDKEGAEVIRPKRARRVWGRVTYSAVDHHLARNMKLYPLVLALAGAGLGLSSPVFRLQRSQESQTAGVNAMPLRVTIVSSTNQIGPAGNFFNNPPPPSVRGEDGLYRIQVTPPVEPRRRPCHSAATTAIGISNRFRKLFGFEAISPAVEHHPVHNHAKLIPGESAAAMPAPPVPNDGLMHIMPFPPIPVEYMENVRASSVHRHSHHRHHRLQDGSFVERLSRALMMLGPWEGRAVAFVLGEDPYDR